MSTAIRDLRSAVIGALVTAGTAAGDRVFTPPVPQFVTAFPRLVVDGYAEDPRAYFGRPGAWVRMQVKGQAKSQAGDAPRESLYEQVHAALHQVPLDIDGHLLLEGTLRRVATYTDPDGETLHFVAVYEGETRIA